MSKLDILKAAAGAVLIVPVLYIGIIIILALQP